MPSLDQAATIKKMEAEGWESVMTVAVAGSVGLGAAVRMARVKDGVAHHILVLPDGSIKILGVGE
jgi:hypothetical protein